MRCGNPKSTVKLVGGQRPTKEPHQNKIRFPSCDCAEKRTHSRKSSSRVLTRGTLRIRGRKKHNLASSFVGRFEVGVGEEGTTIELAVCGEGEGGEKVQGNIKLTLLPPLRPPPEKNGFSPRTQQINGWRRRRRRRPWPVPSGQPGG